MLRLVRRSYAEAVGAVTLAVLVIAVVRIGVMDAWGWVGAAVAWFAIGGYLGYILIGRPSDRTRHLWPLTVVSALGVVTAGALAAVVPRGEHLVAVAVALAGLAATLGYQYLYSRQHRSSKVPQVGEQLPEFPLTTLDGERVSSRVLVGRPRVILFYRGTWCPFCMTQVRELAARYRELERRGVGVALVSPQRADESADLATRFDVPMDFFIDTGGEASRALDLVQAGGVPVIFGAGTDGDTVVPTVLIIDARGVVLWRAIADNHRVRPDPEVFLRVLDDAGIG
jgi:peroxiredoxin